MAEQDQGAVEGQGQEVGGQVKRRRSWSCCLRCSFADAPALTLGPALVLAVLLVLVLRLGPELDLGLRREYCTQRQTASLC